MDGFSRYPIKINSNDLCVPNIVNFSLLRYSNKFIVKFLFNNVIYVSTNSACCSNNEEIIVLKEITNNNNVAKTSIRISLSYLTTEEEIYEFLKVFDKILNDLRKLGE